MSSGSTAVPVSRVGRVWGTSASSAPSVTTISQPVFRAKPMTVEQNVRHLRLGSTPEKSTRSRPTSSTRAAKQSLDGQLILRVVPSTRLTSGRVAWKS